VSIFKDKEKAKRGTAKGKQKIPEDIHIHRSVNLSFDIKKNI
jgi:hypothetical protein